MPNPVSIKDDPDSVSRLTPSGASTNASHGSHQRRPSLVIEPPSGWASLNLRELWNYRDLLWILAARDIKLRYKQTVLGVVWVVLQSLVSAVIFAVIFGRFAHVKTDGVPALPFMLCGLLPWNYFSGILQRGGGSLISDARLISKVYFPRLLIPLASTVAVLIDFGVTLAVLAISMACYHIAPTWRICFVPFFLLLTTLIATGVSLWLSALNVKYRDFMYAMPFLIQVWMYASPVVYAMSTIPARWRLIFTLNPASGFIEGFRWSLLGSAHTGLTVQMVALTTVLAFVAFVSGVFFFRRVERQFADFV